jgi:hypothetical protein
MNLEKEQLIIIDTDFGQVEIGKGVFETIGKLAESRNTNWPEAFNYLLEQGLALDHFAREVIDGGGDAMISMPARDNEPAFDVRFSGHDVLNPKRFGKFLGRTQAIFS